MSNAIAKLSEMAITKGFEPEMGKWAKLDRVLWVEGHMPNIVRNTGRADERLRYFNSEGSPRLPIGEGFIDLATGEAITFVLHAKKVSH